MADIMITIDSQYGSLSRGRHSARIGNGSSARWSPKDDEGRIVIDAAGTYQLHCADGFKRSARAVIVVDEDGGWSMTGDAKRFTVIDHVRA